MQREAVSKISIVFNMFRIAAKMNLAMKIRSVCDISEMATIHDAVNDVLLKHKLVQVWRDYFVFAILIMLITVIY
jgi:hypothetical protein